MKNKDTRFLSDISSSYGWSLIPKTRIGDKIVYFKDTYHTSSTYIGYVVSLSRKNVTVKSGAETNLIKWSHVVENLSINHWRDYDEEKPTSDGKILCCGYNQNYCIITEIGDYNASSTNDDSRNPLGLHNIDPENKVWWKELPNIYNE